MSKFDEKLDLYTAEAKKLGISVDPTLLKAVTKGLGPAIYSNDSSIVAGSDKSELDRIKTNFLIKKLGLADSNELDQAIADAVQKMGAGNKQKHRAIIYYLLVEKFKKQSVNNK